MPILLNALKSLLAAAYLPALLLYAMYFEKGRKRQWEQGRAWLKVAVFLNFLYLLLKGAYFGQFPVTHPAESLSLIALTVGAVYLYIESITAEGKTGVFFSAFAAIFQLAASMFMPIQPVRNQLLSNPLFGFHTLITVTGLSALSIAALYGLMYVMLSQKIRHHQFGKIYENLPALEQLETMGRKASLLGLAFLGTGILLGHIWAKQILGVFFPLDPKIFVSDLSWIVYVIMWIIVKYANIRGLQPGRWAFWGFLVMVAAMAVAGFTGGSFHDFI